MRRFCFLGIGLLLVGCSSGGFSQRNKEDRVNVLTYALNVAPTTLDPALVQDIETTDVLQNIYEGLVGYDESNRIVGVLAEKWEVSPDGRTYTFHLRPAKFHNGRAVTVEDVARTFTRNLSPRFTSPTAINYLSDIVGATAYHEGKTDVLEGVKLTGQNSISITIDQPRPYFLGKLTYACAYIVCPEVVHGDAIDAPSLAIGTGPFRLSDYKPDQQISLEAFADYHGGAPHVTKIERPIILDPTTRLNKYRAGELDMLTLQSTEVAAVAADDKLKSGLTYQARPAVFYIGLSQLAYPPFRDVRVRQALAKCVDRKHIVNDLLGGMPEAHGLIPEKVIGFRDKFEGITYDPEGAKRLLAEAGFPDGKGLPPLQLTYRVQTPASQAIAESVAGTVRQATGWNVRPTGIEWSALLNARNKRKLEAYVLSWYGDYLDPQNFLSFLFQSDSPQNRDGYRSAKFDALTAKADVEPNEAKRLALYQQAEDVLISEAARLPIYYGRDAVLISPRVSGLRSNLFGNLPHSQVVVSGS